jgi:hypothetical protein
MAGKPIPVVDLMFFLIEQKSAPTHVAALMVFDLPDGATARYVADLAAAYRKGEPVPPFNWIPEFRALGMPRWVDAGEIDMTYHVRHTALPAGASHADFLDFVAELTPTCSTARGRVFAPTSSKACPNGSSRCSSRSTTQWSDGASFVARVTASLDENRDAPAVRPIYSIGFGDGHASAAQQRAMTSGRERRTCPAQG